MDPRTGSFDDERRRRRAAGSPPATPTGKLKSVTLLVEWGYEIHRLTIGPRNWKKIQDGKAWGAAGKTYYYEGERFSCYWDFNCRGKPGSLVVSYSGGGDGYVGTWQDALHEEHFE